MNIFFLQEDLPKYREDFFYRLERLLFHHKNKLAVLYTGRCEFGNSYTFVKNYTKFRILFCIFSSRKNDTIVVIPSNIRKPFFILLSLTCFLLNIEIVHYGHLRSGRLKLKWIFYLRMMYNRLSSSLLFYTDKEIERYKKNKLGCLLSNSRPSYALQNGINIDPIRNLRAEYDAGTRNDILYIGRLTSKSNIRELTRAFAKLNMGNVRLKIIGDGELKNDIETDIRSFGVADRVDFYGAINCEKYISKIANSCRISVYPGDVGLSLNHALSYGIPTIIHSNRSAHMPEVDMFEDSWKVLMFEKNNHEDMIVTIKKAFSDFDSLNAISLEAIQQAEFYNTSVMADRFIEMLEDLNNIR